MRQRNPVIHCKSARRRAAGFTLVEVTLALIVFAMMTILFAAVFPMTIRGAQYGGNYTQAAMIAQHKMDEIRSAGFTSLDQGHLSNLNIIDSPQPAGYPITINGGTTYSFTSAENLVSNGTTQGYFAPGSHGVVTVVDYAVLHPGSGVPAGSLALVNISITWTGGATHDGSYQTSALLANGAP